MLKPLGVFTVLVILATSRGEAFVPPAPDTLYVLPHEVRIKCKATLVTVRVAGIPYRAGEPYNYTGSILVSNHDKTITGFTYKTFHCESDVSLIRFGQKNRGYHQIVSVKDALRNEAKLLGDQLELEAVNANRVSIISFSQQSQEPQRRIFLWLNPRGAIYAARFVVLTKRQFFASKPGVSYRRAVK